MLPQSRNCQSMNSLSPCSNLTAQEFFSFMINHDAHTSRALEKQGWKAGPVINQDNCIQRAVLVTIN